MENKKGHEHEQWFSERDTTFYGLPQQFNDAEVCVRKPLLMKWMVHGAAHVMQHRELSLLLCPPKWPKCIPNNQWQQIFLLWQRFAFCVLLKCTLEREKWCQHICWCSKVMFIDVSNVHVLRCTLKRSLQKSAIGSAAVRAKEAKQATPWQVKAVRVNNACRNSLPVPLLVGQN